MIRRPGWRLLLFTVLAAVLTAAVAAAIVGADLGDRYRLVAAFDDVSGLRVGDRVRVAGVPVGAVVSIEVVAGRAEVGLEVDRGLTLPRDSRAVVGWVDLIGNRQLDLEPGDDPEHLEPDDRIERTSARADVSVLAAELGPLLGALDPERINELLTSVDAILTASDEDLVTTTRDVRTLLEVVGERGDTIEGMLRDYGEVAETVASREEQLRQVVSDLTALTDAFGGSEQVLVTAIDDASGMVADVESFLDANEPAIRALLRDLATLVDATDHRLDDLDAGLTALPDALEGLFRVLRHGDYLRVDGVCLGFDDEPCAAVRSEQDGGG